MAEQTGHEIEAEVAEHLAASMDAIPLPEQPPVDARKVLGGGPQWPDGYGKRRHPKERGNNHGRMGHEAAVTEVHRTGRPQMPHSS
jgi:hypothetical protein